MQEEDFKLCSVSDDEFMNYFIEYASAGQVHEGLFEIFLPHSCQNCNKRFATSDVLNEHLNICGNVALSTDSGDNIIVEFNEPTDFSTLNKKELRAELAVRGIKCPSKAKKSGLITLL